MSPAALLVAVALVASPGAGLRGGPAENGLSRLADELAAAIDRRFAAAEGKVVQIAGTRVLIDGGEHAVGSELEWLTPDRPLLDPDSLVRVGDLLRPCGRLRIVASGGGHSAAEAIPLADCTPPAPGDRVQIPAGGVRLVLVPGQATAELTGLLDTLIAILPGRLERSGRYTPVAAPPGFPAQLVAGDRAALASALARAGADAVVVLGLGTRGDRIEALAEIVATAPRFVFDVAQIEAEAVPTGWWRTRPAAGVAAARRSSVEVPGEVLAMAALPAADPAAGSLLVLTPETLFRITQAADGRLQPEPIEDLRHLPRAVVATRVRAGTVAVGGRSDPARFCFATTDLASGWCRGPAGLEAADGVPLAGPSGLLLGRYRAGTDVLDGALRTLAGARAGDAGPFLDLIRSAAGAVLAYRPDSRLEWLGPDLSPTGRFAGPCGHGAAILGRGRILCSAAVPRDQADQVGGVGEPGGGRGGLAPGGAILALAAVDLDGDGRPEVVTASGDARQSALVVFDAGE